MNPVEKLQAAIDKLEALKSESTAGRWFFDSPSDESYPQSDQSLIATDDIWRVCEYFCVFGPNSLTSRGESGKPGHEHLNSESVLSGWGYDASGIDGSDVDRDLIVTLHRTIDALLAILTHALGYASSRIARGRPAPVWSYEHNAIALADAILGEL